MNKEKSFYLFSLYENGCQVSIQTRIYRNGTFHNKGSMNIDQKNSLNAAKYAAKKRGMGFHLISLIHMGMGFHHVNERDVVCIPKNIHAACSHRISDGSAMRLEGILG